MRLNSPGIRTRPRPGSGPAGKRGNYPSPTRTRLSFYSSVVGSEKFVIVRGRVRAMAPIHPLLESACAQTFFLPEPEVAYVPLPVRGLKQYSMMHKEVTR